MSAAPERSLKQRMDALSQANRIRSHRAQLKQRIKAAEIDVVPIIEEPEPLLESMKVWELLLAMPKVGRVKANKLLLSASASPSKTLGGLSERQRATLVGVLRSRR